MDDVNKPSFNIDGDCERITVAKIIEKMSQELARGQSSTENCHKALDSDLSLSFLTDEKLATSQFKLPHLSLFPALSPKKTGEYHISGLLYFHQEEFVKSWVETLNCGLKICEISACWTY